MDCPGCGYLFWDSHFDLGLAVTYVAMIEWDPPPSGEGMDFWVWSRDRFDWIVEDLVECLERGFSTATGSCPNARITSVREVANKETEAGIRTGKDFTKKAQKACELIILKKGKKRYE